MTKLKAKVTRTVTDEVEFEVKEVTEFTDAEKIQFFNDQHATAVKGVREILDDPDDCWSDDLDSVGAKNIQILLGTEAWDMYKKVMGYCDEGYAFDPEDEIDDRIQTEPPVHVEI